MSHCAQLLEELAQADPELRSALSEPGPRGALLAAVAQADEPLVLVTEAPTRVVYSDLVARVLGSSHADLFARSVAEPVSLEGDPREAVERALQRADTGLALPLLVAIPIPDVQGQRCAVLGLVSIDPAVEAPPAPAARPARAPATPQPHGQPGLEMLQSVLEAIDQGCLVMNERFEVVAVNQTAARIARLSPHEILGATHWSLWPSSIDTPPGRMYRDVLQSGAARQMEHHYVGEGIDIWLRIHACRVHGGIVSLFRDITHDMRLRSAEADHRARWEAAKSAVGSLWTLTPAGRMEGSQPGWEAVSGQSAADYQGYGWLGALHPQDADGTTSGFEAAVEKRVRFEVNARIQAPDGNWRLRRLCMAPVLGGSDQLLTEWVGSAHETWA